MEKVAPATTSQIHEEFLEKNMENLGSDINRVNLDEVATIATLARLNTCQDVDVVQGFVKTDKQTIDDGISSP